MTDLLDNISQVFGILFMAGLGEFSTLARRGPLRR